MKGQRLLFGWQVTDRVCIPVSVGWRDDGIGGKDGRSVEERKYIKQLKLIPLSEALVGPNRM